MDVPNPLYKVVMKTLKCCKILLTLMITEVTKSNLHAEPSAMRSRRGKDAPSNPKTTLSLTKVV